MAASETSPSGGLPGRGRRRLLNAVGAVLVVVAILLAGFEIIPHIGTSSVTNSGTKESGGLGFPPAVCTDFSPSQELADTRAQSGPEAGFAGYDEQLWLDFAQNFTGSIAYNVTLRAQNDSSGFGPVYLLNGRTDAGYWYQVGIGWDFAATPGTEYLPGFRFVYEVWDAATATPVFPTGTSTTPEEFAASPGDVVILNLSISSGQVAMFAGDWNTSATASASFDSYGASSFMGYSQDTSTYPTSLVTEWYHALPYYCSDQTVVYSNQLVALGSAYLRIDEWNFTSVQSSSRFNSSVAGECCVFSTSAHQVSFGEPALFQYLSTNGTTIYADAHEFVTP